MKSYIKKPQASTSHHTLYSCATKKQSRKDGRREGRKENYRAVVDTRQEDLDGKAAVLC